MIRIFADDWQVDGEAVIRKQALFLLQNVQPASRPAKPAWDHFLALYNVLEEFAPHLIEARLQAPFDRLHFAFEAVAQAADGSLGWTTCKGPIISGNGMALDQAYLLLLHLPSKNTLCLGVIGHTRAQMYCRAFGPSR